jgi:hypothetical protein
LTTERSPSVQATSNRATTRSGCSRRAIRQGSVTQKRAAPARTSNHVLVSRFTDAQRALPTPSSSAPRAPPA